MNMRCARMMLPTFLLVSGLSPTVELRYAQAESAPANVRKPADDTELQYWLQNMIWYHGFETSEVVAATGMTATQIESAQEKFNIRKETRPERDSEASLLVLPYPGGRHPRIGFLDGAVEPQRETKVSVFTPWDTNDYVVVDVPEAIWSNLGLTYLAHTHVPTIWSRQGIELKKQEWKRGANGELDIERTLPNGIAFGAHVVPAPEAVLMELWLKNGTDQTLSDLRVQNCVMLKGAAGFTAQTNANKVFRKPYTACRSDDGKRWVISAWTHCQRAWGNEKCPCLHSDPQFPDCGPGETRRVHGWLSFYEGENIQAEFDRIEATGWRKQAD